MRKHSRDLWQDADKMLHGEWTPSQFAAVHDTRLSWAHDVLG